MAREIAKSALSLCHPQPVSRTMVAVSTLVRTYRACIRSTPILLVLLLLAARLPSSLTAADRWDWSVLEQGYSSGLNALASSGTLVVAVGASGQILTSSDSVSWTRCRTLTTTTLMDVAWSGGAFVAVGNSGLILRSTDGVNWTPQTSRTSSNLSKIAWNGSRFFVSGGGGGISSDGIQWSFGVSSAPIMADLTVDGNTFLGVSGLKAYFSADGVTWTSSTIKTDTGIDDFPSITRSGGVYYAVVEQEIYTSLNGTTWVLNRDLYEHARLFSNGVALFALGPWVWYPGQDNKWQMAYQAFSEKFRDVLWSGTRYVVLDQDGRIAVSPDLQAWTFPIHNSLHPSSVVDTKPLCFKSRIVTAGAVSTPFLAAGIYSSADGRLWDLQTGAFTDYYALASNEDRLLATGRNKVVIESTDGTHWQQLPQGSGGSSYYSIAWTGERFFGLTIGEGLYSSVNGSDWQMVLPDELDCLLWTGTRYLGGGYGGIFASDDGLQWTRVAETDWGVNKIGAGPGGFYAVDYYHRIYRSSDGLTWTTVYDPANNSSLLDIVWTGSALVAVGSGATAHSTDGVNWTTTGGASYLSAVAWTGSQLVAVGYSGAVMRSTNGTVWTKSTLSGTPDLLDVVWTGSQLIAVGELGKIFTSPNGQTWTERQSGIATDLNCVQMHGSLIVAAGDAGRVISSPDGIAWTIRDAGLTRNCTDLAVKGGQLVGLFEGNILSSTPDGVTWNSGPVRGLGGASRLLWNGTSLIAVGAGSYASPDGLVWTVGGPGPGSTNSPLVLVWNGTRFIAAGGTKIQSSDDGLQWTAAPIVTQDLRCVATSGPVTVAVGYQGNILRSNDGLTWTNVSPPADTSPVRFQAIVWDGNRFIASSPDLAVSSTDGVTWSAIGPGALNDVASNGSEFVAVGADGRVRHSSDGIHWQPHNLNTFADLKAVSFVNGSWFATGTQGALFRSQDGSSWASANSGIGATSLGRVSWNGAIYLTGSDSYSSADGWTWTSRNTPDAMSWTGADGNVFRGEFTGPWVGYSLESPDGISWTRVNSRSKLTGATYGGGLLVATSAGGELLISTDGVTWTTIDTPARAWLQSVTWTGSMFVAVGFRVGISATVLTSSDGFTWQQLSPSGFESGTSLNHVVWTGSRLVAVSSSARIYVSTNAAAWTEVGNPAGATMDMIAWSGSMLVAVGANGAIITSPDGLAWTKRTSNTTASLWGVTWTGSQFVAVGNSGVIVTSPDGTTWTPRTSGFTSAFSSVASNGSKIVAAGWNRLVVVSDDGVDWSAVDTGVGGFDFALGAQGLLYLFGINGTVLDSGNGLTWRILRRGPDWLPLEPVDAGTQRWETDGSSIYHVARPDLVWKQRRAAGFKILDLHWTGTHFVAVGSGGGAETSPNGVDWLESFIPTGDQLAAVASSSARVVVVGNSGTIAVAANPSTQLMGMAAWCHARALAKNEEPPPVGTCGAEDLLAYGLGVPFSPGEVSVFELTPHLLSGGRRGLEFGVPVIDRPDLRYVVEESATMEAESWMTIASKNPGQPWTGSATITANFLADYWMLVEVATGLESPPAQCFYRLKIELVAH